LNNRKSKECGKEACNCPELMRRKYCFKSARDKPWFLNVLIYVGVLRRLKSDLGLKSEVGFPVRKVVRN
jgi:hypothetical protein